MVLVFVLFVDQKCWSEMFPSIVAGVTARSDAAIFSGNFGSRIQLVSSVRMHIRSFSYICVFLASELLLSHWLFVQLTLWIAGHLQMTAELLVQSPRLLNRRINFLRYTKPVAEGQWAVMDVSVDGILGPLGSRTADAAAVANNTGFRLLPSGCLIEDMGNGYCKVSTVQLQLITTIPP